MADSNILDGAVAYSIAAFANNIARVRAEEKARLVEERKTSESEALKPNMFSYRALKDQYLAAHPHISEGDYTVAFEQLTTVGAFRQADDVLLFSKTGRELATNGWEPYLAALNEGVARLDAQKHLELTGLTHHTIEKLAAIDLDNLSPSCREALTALAGHLQPLVQGKWADRDARTHEMGWSIAGS